MGWYAEGELSDDAEAVPTAAQRPEEVPMAALARGDEGAVGEHDARLQDVDGAAAEALGERAETTRHPTPGDADGVAAASHDNLVVRRRVGVEVHELNPRLHGDCGASYKGFLILEKLFQPPFGWKGFLKTFLRIFSLPHGYVILTSESGSTCGNEKILGSLGELERHF